MTLVQYARKVAEILGGECGTFCCPNYAEVVRKSDGKQIGLYGPASKRNWRTLNEKIIKRLEAQNPNRTIIAAGAADTD